MPEDWDEDMDGEWEPPMIPNPEYKVNSNMVYRRDCVLINAFFLDVCRVTGNLVRLTIQTTRESGSILRYPTQTMIQMIHSISLRILDLLDLTCGRYGWKHWLGDRGQYIGTHPPLILVFFLLLTI